MDCIVMEMLKTETINIRISNRCMGLVLCQRTEKYVKGEVKEFNVQNTEESVY